MRTRSRSPRATQTQIATALGVDQSAVSKVLNRDPHYRVAQATQRRILSAAQRMSYDFSRIRPLRRREHPRVSVDLPARVTIRFHDGRLYARGRARVYERSPGGAFVGAFRLSKMALPLRPFTIELEIQAAAGQRERVRYRPIRFVLNGTLALGLQCERSPGPDLAQAA